jgi:hypothetical protein
VRLHHRRRQRQAFGQPEIKLGIIPGAGGTQRLPRAVGKAKAMDLVLTGRMMDATEAERAGLVSRVVPLDKLMDEALGAALVICDFSQIAVMAAKESVNRAFESGLSDGVMFERRMFHALFATADQKEGMDAFVNKRVAPRWCHAFLHSLWMNTMNRCLTLFLFSMLLAATSLPLLAPLPVLAQGHPAYLSRVRLARQAGGDASAGSDAQRQARPPVAWRPHPRHEQPAGDVRRTDQPGNWS